MSLALAAAPLLPARESPAPRAFPAYAFMAQAFSRQAVLLIKLTAAAAVALVCAGIWLWRLSITPDIAMDEPVDQPIPFSHKHHVGDDGIDCRYCHTTVTTSSSAGMPATSICLSCHAQLYRDAPILAPLHESLRRNQPLQWTRVHKLPDFVYFDHSIHVNKGVACVECHGRVDQMPLTRRVASLDMKWCIGCHRDPSSHIRPADQVFSMSPTPALSEQDMAMLHRLYQLQDSRRMTDCSSCHR